MPPSLSVIVVFFNMRREAARSLYTLSTAYQRGVSAADYRIIAIDNASTEPLDPEFVASFGPNFAYHRLEHDLQSPAIAVNAGVDLTATEHVAVIVDGARMLTPGMIAATLAALKTVRQPLVGALAWHIGYDYLTRHERGYDQAAEDRLLEEFDWRADGYELFRHSALAKSSRVGFLGGLPTELSYFATPRAAFLDLGGFDERFKNPGGGLVNHDFLKRAVDGGNFDFVMLLGEGTFHQFHGGVTSSSAPESHPGPKFNREYEQIHGMRYRRFAQPRVTYFGALPDSARAFLGAARMHARKPKRRKQ